MPLTAVPATVSLVDGDESIVVRPGTPGHTSPVLCSQWDAGAPTAREAVSDRIGADGSVDVTQYGGARNVTLDLHVFGDESESAYDLVERLAAMAHPGRRPYLYVTRGSGEPWRMMLRGTPFSVTYGRLAAARIDMTLNFMAPDGYFESPERSETTLAQDDTEVDGLTFPITWPIDFGHAGGALLPADVTVTGSVPVEPVLRIYGPSTNPKVFVDNGSKFGFTGLTLAAGQYVEVDMRRGTVNLNGDPTTSIYYRVDWTYSSWWRLPQGTSHIGFLGGGGGTLTVSWRDRRLTA